MRELIFWVRHLAVCARVDIAVVVGWLRGMALIVATSALLALVALAATGIRMAGSFAATIIVAAAAVLLIAVPWALVKTKDRRFRG